jgi:biopolymer transport protein ExbB
MQPTHPANLDTNLDATVQAVWALLQHGGWVMIAIFAAGQFGWYFVCERFFYYRRMDGGKRRDRGLVGRVSRAVLDAGTIGQEAMVVKARELLATEVPRLNRHLNTVAVLAGVAPLLGLAGTVIGIMDTFHAITQYGAGNPAMLAGGIAQALMVTEAGLVVAFPLLISHDYLQNRADHIESECVTVATGLIHGGPNPRVGMPREGIT